MAQRRASRSRGMPSQEDYRLAAITVEHLIKINGDTMKHRDSQFRQNGSRNIAKSNLVEVVLELTVKQLEFLFGLVQFYGETRQFIAGLSAEERYIRRRRKLSRDDVADLFFIKKQKGYAELALKNVALELEEKHGFCTPGVTGWRTSDQDRFFADPVFSASKQSCCCPKPNP